MRPRARPRSGPARGFPEPPPKPDPNVLQPDPIAGQILLWPDPSTGRLVPRRGGRAAHELSDTQWPWAMPRSAGIGFAPLTDWLFGCSKRELDRRSDLAEATKTRRGEGGSRVGGQEVVPHGQVPRSLDMRRKDMAELNDLVSETYDLALNLGLIPRDQPRPRRLVPDDVKLIIAKFVLTADNQCTLIKADCLSSLLPVPHLAHKKRRQHEYASFDDSEGSEAADGAPGPDGGQKRRRRKKEGGGTAGGSGGAGRFWPSIGLGRPGCAELRSVLKDREIVLRVYDLLTGFKDRWLDSVVIDAYIHLLQEHCPFRDVLYVNSAEHDPTLNEIAHTPSCFKYIICPLFYRSHWTVLFISHPSRRIRYLNSQVVDRTTPEFQTKPFAELFPGYKVSMLTPTKQCDQSSCGVLVAMWAYIFLFYDEDEMDQIKCPDIGPFRDTLLKQLVLSYVLCNRSLQPF
jgi:Ulp1 protease family, C-terminal catalytic domain